MITNKLGTKVNLDLLHLVKDVIIQSDDSSRPDSVLSYEWTFVLNHKEYNVIILCFKCLLQQINYDKNILRND